MKGVGLALIVVACFAAMFATDAGWVEMSRSNADSYSMAATVALLYAAWWFARKEGQGDE